MPRTKLFIVLLCMPISGCGCDQNSARPNASRDAPVVTNFEGVTWESAAVSCSKDRASSWPNPAGIYILRCQIDESIHIDLFDDARLPDLRGQVSVIQIKHLNRTTPRADELAVTVKEMDDAILNKYKSIDGNVLFCDTGRQRCFAAKIGTFRDADTGRWPVVALFRRDKVELPF